MGTELAGAGFASPRRARTGWIVGAMSIVLLGFWFQRGWGGHTVIRWVDDLGCELSAAAAAWAALRAGHRNPRFRTCWRLIGIGAALWAAGQVIWCAYDLGLGVVLSIPSAADAGYLLFPVFAVAALAKLPGDDESVKASQWLLDGGIVSLSALLLTWSTVIEPTGHASGHTFTTVVALAYPVSDVLLLTATVLAALHCGVGRRQLTVLAASLAFLAIADAWFSYLSVSGEYQAGALADLTYIAAFATMAGAALTWSGNRTRREHPMPDWSRAALPYIPFLVASGVTVGRHTAGRHLDNVEVGLWAAVTLLVLGRQSLALAQNRKLLAELRLQKDQLSASAMTDALTGLANRALFVDRVHHVAALHARDMRQASLCWIDLDDFKVVNDTHGHSIGDELLVKVADRLRGAVRTGDTLARLGGDEFALLIEDGSDAAQIADRIRSALQRPFQLAGQRIAVTASIGVTTLRPESGATSAQDLITRADIAMYQAKNNGKNQVILHLPGMTVPGADDPAMRLALRVAIDKRDIQLDYQPIYWADDGSLRGFEALARWTSDGVPIPPYRFVAQADRFGYGPQLGDLILDTAIAQAARWSRSMPGPGPMIGANLSPSQLLDPALPDRIAAMLARHRLPATQLILEITESALLTDSSIAMDVTRSLHDRGIQLSLDDFGTGYSSLAHLRGLPLQSIKIDKSFVTFIDSKPDARKFIAAVIRLGHDLGLRVVIEGVETPVQLEIVRDLGCDMVQGYLLGGPLPAEAIDLTPNMSFIAAAS